MNQCESVSPVAHVVKVLCELGEVGTLLFILLLGPQQHLWNLEEDRRVTTGPARGEAHHNAGGFLQYEKRLKTRSPVASVPQSCRIVLRLGG